MTKYCHPKPRSVSEGFQSSLRSRFRASDGNTSSFQCVHIKPRSQFPQVASINNARPTVIAVYHRLHARHQAAALVITKRLEAVNLCTRGDVGGESLQRGDRYVGLGEQPG